MSVVYQTSFGRVHLARTHLEKNAARAWELLGLPPRERRARRSTVTQADVAARARRGHRRGDP